MEKGIFNLIRYIIFFLIFCFCIIGIAYCYLPVNSLSEVATAISGFTAPTLSLLGSILLYLALIKQSEANSKIQTQIDLGEEKIYFDYFLKCQNEWRLAAYNNRGSLQAPLAIEEGWLQMDITGLISQIYSADDSNRSVRVCLLNKYCSRQILPIKRVVKSLNISLSNITSDARKETLLVEIEQFKTQILSNAEIHSHRESINLFIPINKGFEFTEFFELMDLFENLWTIDI